MSLVLAVPSLCAAQLNGLLTAPDQSGFSGFPSTRPPGPWATDYTLWIDYGLRTRDHGAFIPRHTLDATVAAQIGIMSRGALAVRVPLMLFQSQPPRSGVAAGGLGNVSLDGRVRVWGAPAGTNGVVKDGSALALRGVLMIPVFTDYGTERPVSQFSAIADIEVFGIIAGAELAWIREYAPDTARERRDFLQLSGGLRLPLRLATRLWPGHAYEAALVEVAVSTPPRDFFAGSRTPVEGRLGYRFAYDDLQSTLLFGTALHDVQGSADFRVLLAVGYAPRRHDQDGDGVPDSEDQCVHLPEDRDGYEDEDGCADDDNDGDMIVDEDDRCPLVPAEEGRDNDEDGCTDP